MVLNTINQPDIDSKAWNSLEMNPLKESNITVLSTYNVKATTVPLVYVFFLKNIYDFSDLYNK
jgi:hypothetical protein